MLTVLWRKDKDVPILREVRFFFSVLFHTTILIGNRAKNYAARLSKLWSGFIVLLENKRWC
jgi:hypothetical protein